jgi:hypothetical protein
MTIDLLIGTVAVGLGATLVMDLWAVFLKRAFNVASANYCLVGRWLRHMTGGVFRHASIAAAAPKPAECAVGWVAHYAIGALFALALVALATAQWLRSPTLMPALIFGTVTVAILSSWRHRRSARVASSKAPNPARRGCAA